jgi:hypothetical protein
LPRAPRSAVPVGLLNVENTSLLLSTGPPSDVFASTQAYLGKAPFLVNNTECDWASPPAACLHFPLTFIHASSYHLVVHPSGTAAYACSHSVDVLDKPFLFLSRIQPCVNC